MQNVARKNVSYHVYRVKRKRAERGVHIRYLDRGEIASRLSRKGEVERSRYDREEETYDTDKARVDANAIVAKVLSNRKPPYSLVGGLYDTLKDTDGEFFAISNEEAEKAAAMFEELEGIDINPAAAVATASLIQAVEGNLVGKDDVIMLNITGGGEKRFKENKDLFYLKPEKVFDVDTDKEEIKDFIRSLKY